MRLRAPIASLESQLFRLCCMWKKRQLKLTLRGGVTVAELRFMLYAYLPSRLSACMMLFLLVLLRIVLQIPLSFPHALTFVL